MASRKPKEPDFKKTLELWVNSDLKIQALVFFHDNPGVMETIEDLAKRLGANVAGLRKDLAGHLALGIIKKQKAGPHTLLVFDREREGEVQGAIARHLAELTKKPKGRATA